MGKYTVCSINFLAFRRKPVPNPCAVAGLFWQEFSSSFEENKSFRASVEDLGGHGPNGMFRSKFHFLARSWPLPSSFLTTIMKKICKHTVLLWSAQKAKHSKTKSKLQVWAAIQAQRLTTLSIFPNWVEIHDENTFQIGSEQAPVA